MIDRQAIARQVRDWAQEAECEGEAAIGYGVAGRGESVEGGADRQPLSSRVGHHVPDAQRDGRCDLHAAVGWRLLPVRRGRVCAVRGIRPQVKNEAGTELEAVGEWCRSYWIRQFGFTRSDEMKGMYLVRTPLV